MDPDLEYCHTKGLASGVAEKSREGNRDFAQRSVVTPPYSTVLFSSNATSSLHSSGLC